MFIIIRCRRLESNFPHCGPVIHSGQVRGQLNKIRFVTESNQKKIGFVLESGVNDRSHFYLCALILNSRIVVSQSNSHIRETSSSSLPYRLFSKRITTGKIVTNLQKGYFHCGFYIYKNLFSDIRVVPTNQRRKENHFPPSISRSNAHVFSRN